MGKIFIAVALLALAVVIPIIADRPAPRADFTFINRGDVTSLDLQKLSWMQDLRVARVLFEGLVQNDVFTQGYDTTPAVAHSWELSPDGLTYTFRLREEARWSNGAPVTAHDFVYSWRRAILPDTAADYAGLFMLIDGAQAFFDWRTAALDAYAGQRGHTQADADALWAVTERVFRGEEKPESLGPDWAGVAIRALDDLTLEVRLAQVTPYFLDLCAFPIFYPVYPPLVRQYEQPDPDSGRLLAQPGWTKPPHLVSNGPFKLASWRFKREMRLEANEHYWRPETLAVRSISIPTVDDPNAAVLAFETGGVDWVSDVTPVYKGDILAKKLEFYAEHRDLYESLKAQGLDQFEIDRRLPDDPRKNIHAIPAFGTFWWNFNCLPKLPDGRPNPLHDARVRRAFSMVIDKESIVREVKRCGEPVANTIIPRDSIGGYESPRGLACISDFTDPAERRAWIQQARDLLAEAGYPDPSKLPTIELLFNKDAGHDQVAQVIARNWQEHLGVPVLLAQKEIKVFKDDLKNANYMTSRAGWYGDYGDPTTFLDLSRTGDGNNDRKYSNAEFDGLLDAAKLERDPARRMALLTEAERIIMERDLPMVPIYHYVNMYLFDPDIVSGLNPHPRSEQIVSLIDMLGDGRGPDTPRVMRRGDR